VIFVLAKLARFWQDLQKPRFESGRERFSRQLLSLFQTGSSRINQSGGWKGLFDENENFTEPYKNLGEAVKRLSAK